MSVYRDMARDAGCTTEEEIQQMAMMIEEDHRRHMEEERVAQELCDLERRIAEEQENDA